LRRAVLLLQKHTRQLSVVKALRVKGLNEIWKQEQGILLDRFVKNKKHILSDKSFTKQIFKETVNGIKFPEAEVVKAMLQLYLHRQNLMH